MGFWGNGQGSNTGAGLSFLSQDESDVLRKSEIKNHIKMYAYQWVINACVLLICIMFFFILLLSSTQYKEVWKKSIAIFVTYWFHTICCTGSCSTRYRTTWAFCNCSHVRISEYDSQVAAGYITDCFSQDPQRNPADPVEPVMRIFRQLGLEIEIDML